MVKVYQSIAEQHDLEPLARLMEADGIGCLMVDNTGVINWAAGVVFEATQLPRHRLEGSPLEACLIRLELVKPDSAIYRGRDAKWYLLRNHPMERDQTLILFIDVSPVVSDPPEGLSRLAQSEEKLRALQNMVSSLDEANRAAEQRRKEAELASQWKSEFLATVSHDIRTPMNAIMGMAQVLEGLGLQGEAQECVEVIRSSGQNLLTLLNDILDFSKVESGFMEFDDNDFSLKRVIEAVIALMRNRAREKKIKLAMELGEQEEVILKGDPLRLRQVLLNLVGNALKFTEQGSVTIEVKTLLELDSSVVLQFLVRDTGVGIPDEHRDNLFDPFVQVGSSASSKAQGTGLGLAICKKLVQAQGGEIGLDSHEGQGSTFWFSLPFPLGDPNYVEAKAMGEAPMQGSARNILVAEDEIFNQLVAKKFLALLGHNFTIVGNGKKAVETLQERDFDLVILDMRMPVMGGVEAAQAIRRLPDPNKARVPIIAMTANALKRDVDQCFAAGMNDFLAKPVMLEDLQRVIASADRVSESLFAGGKNSSAGAKGKSQKELPILDGERVRLLLNELGADVVHHVLGVSYSSLRASLEKFLKAIEGQDWGEASKWTHKLSGTAAGAGMARLAAVSGHVEQTLDREPGPLPEDLVAEMTRLVDKSITLQRQFLADNISDQAE